jgi:hypothetical protein
MKCLYVLWNYKEQLCIYLILPDLFTRVFWLNQNKPNWTKTKFKKWLKHFKNYLLSVKRECRDVEDFCPLLQGSRHRPEPGFLFARKLKMFLHRSRAQLLHRRRRRCQTSQERLDGTSHYSRSIEGIARLIWGIWNITDTLY